MVFSSLYLGRQHSKVKTYLDTGQGNKKYEKVISGAKADGSVILVQRPLATEGKQLGSIMLCISKDAVNQKITTPPV